FDAVEIAVLDESFRRIAEFILQGALRFLGDLVSQLEGVGIERLYLALHPGVEADRGFLDRHVAADLVATEEVDNLLRVGHLLLMVGVFLLGYGLANLRPANLLDQRVDFRLRVIALEGPVQLTSGIAAHLAGQRGLVGAYLSIGAIAARAGLRNFG